MTGWGKNVSSTIDEETPFVNILQEITLPITTYDTCNTFVNTLIGNEQPVAYSGILCVGNGEEKGGCRGDSGGPIIVQKPGQTSWTLAGVISCEIDLTNYIMHNLISQLELPNAQQRTPTQLELTLHFSWILSTLISTTALSVPPSFLERQQK